MQGYRRSGQATSGEAQIRAAKCKDDDQDVGVTRETTCHIGTVNTSTRSNAVDNIVVPSLMMTTNLYL